MGRPCCCLRMATQMKMWTLKGNYVVPQYYSKLKASEEKTYASLKVHLEENLTLEWPFEFWNNDNIYGSGRRWRVLNNVVGNMYVLPQQSEVDETPNWCHLDDRSDIASSIHQQVAEEEFPQIEEDNEDQLVEPLGGSRIKGSTWQINIIDHQMNSNLIPNDMWEWYLEHARRWRSWNVHCMLTTDGTSMVMQWWRFSTLNVAKWSRKQKMINEHSKFVQQFQNKAFGIYKPCEK